MLPVLGALVDELIGSSLGTVFVLTAAVGAAVAAWWCTRAGAWWVVYAPPVVAELITVVAEEMAGKTGATGDQGLTSGVVHWAIDAFPAMAVAEAAVIVVLAVRWFRLRGSRRK
ncbi:DUF6542 domain-containing protein [Streptomyces sp. YGL11-2]|uniref:DUF6542 domain-containing protein n=1 Tax=Streptomyces sp. YGL11-2 TaxID=3414028 RepID=UPI003CFA9CE3